MESDTETGDFIRFLTIKCYTFGTGFVTFLYVLFLFFIIIIFARMVSLTWVVNINIVVAAAACSLVRLMKMVRDDNDNDKRCPISGWLIIDRFYKS